MKTESAVVAFGAGLCVLVLAAVVFFQTSHDDPLCRHKLWIVKTALGVYADKHHSSYPKTLSDLEIDLIPVDLNFLPECLSGKDSYYKGYEVSGDRTSYTLHCDREKKAHQWFRNSSYLEYSSHRSKGTEKTLRP